MHQIREFSKQELTSLEAFLRRFPATTQFLREALRDDGLDGAVRWLGAFDSDGTLLGAGARCADGTLLLESADHAREIARALARNEPDAITGVSAEWHQAVAAYDAVWPGRAPLDSHREWVFSVSPQTVKPPAQLLSGEWTCVAPSADQIELVSQWRAKFMRETLHFSGDDAGLHWLAERDIAGVHARGDDFVLIADGQPVAFAKLTIVLSDVVEIGGVWTPHEYRGHGYARGVVAGAAMAAAARGVPNITLFMEPWNASARRTYEAIGFERVAEYCGDYFHARLASMTSEAARHGVERGV